jgi:hypothetical protein
MTPLIEASEGARDFEFLYGEWMVHCRRLRRAQGGCDEWDRFDALQKCWPLLGGLGNVDELVSDDGAPLCASLRFFDPASRQWTVYSVSTHDGLVQPPICGAFNNGIGEFYCEHRQDGRPVLVRDRWLQTGSSRPNWERAMSADGGNTWETNWLMNYIRVDWPLETGLETPGTRYGSRVAL